MAISIRGNAGAWVASNAATQTVTLPTHAAGDMLIVRAAQKPYSAAPTCATAGWAAAGTAFANGTTANGNGAGSVILIAFWKIAASASETNPVVTWNTTSAPGACCPVVYQKGAGETWIDPTGAGGGDATPRTAHTATIASHLSTTAGDMVDFFTAWCDNFAATVPTFTQAGLTLGTVAEQPAAALSDATSNDIACDGGYRLVTAGTSSAAAVVTGTFGASEQGGSWTTRLRVTTVDNRNASVTSTGGGVATETGTKGATIAAAFTGGGILSVSASGAHTKAVASTGGGVAVAASTGARQVSAAVTGGGVAAVAPVAGRQAVVTATGGGIVTIDYAAVSVENHDVSVVATGGGVAAVGVRSARNIAAAVTASGVVTVAPVAGRQSSPASVGGGVASVAQRSARSTSATATGGGAASLSVLAARMGAALMSGGGVLTAVQTTDRRVAPTATGAGLAALSVRSARQMAAALTGGGVATVVGIAAVAEAPLGPLGPEAPVGLAALMRIRDRADRGLTTAARYVPQIADAREVPS